MALFLLNISVDTAEPYDHLLPEDLSINDQETIVEIVLEQFLGFEDAMEEYDDPGPSEQNKKRSASVDVLAMVTIHPHGYTSTLAATAMDFGDPGSFLANGFRQLSTPPPEA